MSPDITQSRRITTRIAPAMLLGACLAGCATPHPTRAPPFATVPYAPFSRSAAIAIANREWRAFGAPVDDDPPGTRAPLRGDDKPERQEGLWQRVGEYWYIGQPRDTLESRWTGKHDATGAIFPPERDADFAWSAAFISYVMRQAGARDGFPYAPNHATYIDLAWQRGHGLVAGYLLSAERVQAYPPRPGDIICTGRAGAKGITYDDLPASTFPAHCDIVVARSTNTLDVIGGNVDDAVTMKHVPIGPNGCLALPDGTVLDPRYPWFVVLRILYTR